MRFRVISLVDDEKGWTKHAEIHERAREAAADAVATKWDCCTPTDRVELRTPRRPTMTNGRTHGRIATYVAGCRCERCKEAARRERARRRWISYERIEVPCWCNRSTVWVSVEDVALGVTRTCRQRGCSAGFTRKCAS